MKARKKFAKMLEEPGGIILPGAPDALAAKIIEEVGFRALFTTGYGTSATVLAQPDRGLLDYKEMVERASQISEAVNIPVFADADTGYGGVLNVQQTVKGFEKSGVAGIFIEDQVWPKRCGHMEGKKVIDEDEFLAKLEAALDAREDKDFKIMARTDIRAIDGLEAAIERGKKCEEIGVDLLFIEAPQSKKELKRIGNEFPNIPLMANMIEHGKTPILNKEELEELGYKIIVWPLSALYASAQGMYIVLSSLRENGETNEVMNHLMPFDKFNEMIGLKEIQKLEEKYSN
ncbi:methylisocitrate lyase [Halanaerobium sp. DL-01]|uniref:isocitrate lyase/PEP mutase family protein n=1 Tax=Halanaerobium sp. DL-01 TaxID=1653064 RepID=UPI000DF3D33B|nr:isocitrate lyase/PEP mutase family protein [Halanaerobium sp. DL-01]RCW78132.1 methylisocitrate lyase [Halanaerobium sp. DL-01]